MSQQGAIVFQKGVHFRQESGGRKRAACSGEDGVHLSTMNKKIFLSCVCRCRSRRGQGRPRTVLQLPATCGQLSGKGTPPRCQPASDFWRNGPVRGIARSVRLGACTGESERPGRKAMSSRMPSRHGAVQPDDVMGRRDPRSRSPGLPGRPDAGDPAATGRLFRCVPTSGGRTAGGQGAFLRCADAATERSVRRSFFAGPEAPGKEKAGPLAGTGLARRI